MQKIHVSIKVETNDDDFAEYETDVEGWDDAEAFLSSTRRHIEKAQAIAEAVIPEDEQDEEDEIIRDN